MLVPPLPARVSGFVLAAALASPGFAQERWSCAAIKECRNDFDTCETLAGANFPLDLSADGKTAQMVTPVFRLTLALSQTTKAGRTFETATDDGTFSVTLDPDGVLVGLRTHESFGTMVEHRLTATCKKAAN
jgi:hypothetical protein